MNFLKNQCLRTNFQHFIVLYYFFKYIIWGEESLLFKFQIVLAVDGLMGWWEGGWAFPCTVPDKLMFTKNYSPSFVPIFTKTILSRFFYATKFVQYNQRTLFLIESIAIWMHSPFRSWTQLRRNNDNDMSLRQ